MSIGLDELYQQYLDQSGTGGIRGLTGVDAPETPSAGYDPDRDISIADIWEQSQFQRHHPEGSEAFRDATTDEEIKAAKE